MIDISQERDRQRFIDGELSIADENDAIIQCEINPDLWRGLALLMVEQRRLKIGMSPVDDDTRKITLSDSNARKSCAAVKESWWVSWRMVASIAALIGFSVIAFEAGRKEGVANSVAAQETGGDSGPVIVQVQYPDKQPVADSRLASMRQNIFDSEAQAIFAEAGYRVDETMHWQIVNEGNSYVAVPNREVRFVSVQP